MEVLDPAQLVTAYANQQLAQQPQEQHQDQQQPLMFVEHCKQHSTHQAPGSLQSTAVQDTVMHQQSATHVDGLAAQDGPSDESPGHTQDWQGTEAAQQWREHESQEEEELIRMDDPLFGTLSERRQKLMALEEVLLNTGIEG